MRLASIGVSCVFVLCGFAVCHGQKAAGPATLENLTRDDAAPAQRPVAVDASEPASWRLDGTLARPDDAFHHPDLDKAWAEYAAAAKNATDSIKRALDKQFDAATSKGDLAAAERWQAAREIFEKSGRLPADARSLASVAKADCTRAKDDIERAYENLIKALTMDKRIADAKAVRDEWKLVVAAANPPDVGARLPTHRYKKVVTSPAGERQQLNEALEFKDRGEIFINGRPSSLRWQQTGADSIRIEIGRPHGVVDLRLKPDDSLDGRNTGRSDGAVWRWELVP